MPRPETPTDVWAPTRAGWYRLVSATGPSRRERARAWARRLLDGLQVLAGIAALPLGALLWALILTGGWWL